MKKYDELYSDLNMLLSMLTGGMKLVDSLIDDFYLVKFKNPAPGILLRQQIEKMYKHLECSFK